MSFKTHTTNLQRNPRPVIDKCPTCGDGTTYKLHGDGECHACHNSRVVSLAQCISDDPIRAQAVLKLPARPYNSVKDKLGNG